MVKEEKIKAVEELRQLMNSYRVIGIIDIFKLPTAPLQEIKSNLKEDIKIKVVKKSILLHAIKSREDLSVLEKYIPKQPAVFFTNLDWCKAYTKISKLRPKVFAKEGDVVAEEILVKTGATNLQPGPVISEFAKVKIPVGTEGGKISIKKDTVVAKAGDKISKDLASILRKLGIKSVNIGLNVLAIFDGGMVYTKDVLDLLGEKYLQKIQDGFNKALNLSIAIEYPTRHNIGYLISRYYQNAKFIENMIGGVKV